MKIQKATDYAIRVLSYLSSHDSSGDLLTAQMISEAVGVTHPFFIKIANQLKQQGLLNTVQGRHGGYQLARRGEMISVYDVFVAIEGELSITNCQKCGEPGVQNIVSCVAHSYFKEMQKMMVETMSSKKISEFHTKKVCA